MIWLISYDDGNIESYASLTRNNKIEYAERRGYRYLLTQGKNREEPKLSPPWCLVGTIRQSLGMASEGDWICLTGADSCVVNMDFDLEDLIATYSTKWKDPPTDHPDLLITRDKCGLNTNGILLRNCEWSRELIERWWMMRGPLYEVVGLDNTHHWWAEQAALVYLLNEPGFTGRVFPERDGVHGVEPMPDVAQRIAFIPQETTNGYDPRIYGDDYKEPILIAHYPGKQTEERTYFIKRALGLVTQRPLPEGYWVDGEDKVRPPQPPPHA